MRKCLYPVCQGRGTCISHQETLTPGLRRSEGSPYPVGILSSPPKLSRWTLWKDKLIKTRPWGCWASYFLCEVPRSSYWWFWSWVQAAPGHWTVVEMKHKPDGGFWFWFWGLWVLNLREHAIKYSDTVCPLVWDSTNNSWLSLVWRSMGIRTMLPVTERLFVEWINEYMRRKKTVHHEDLYRVFFIYSLRVSYK